MAGNPTCCRCGAQLPLDLLEGLCPRCIATVTLGAAFGSGPVRPAESAAPDSAAPPPRGTRLRYFGDYELLDEIGCGSMGLVYKARQVSLNRLVALKLILAGPYATEELIRRFRAEAAAAAKLEHPNIVSIYEVGEHQGQHYFSMRLVEGPSLAVLLARRTGRGKEATPGLFPCSALLDSPSAAAKLVATVARAVHHAHQRGILHRDLKPGNIVLDARGEPHVTDFGLAKLVDLPGELTRSEAILGTPHYMSPEQAQGRHKDLTVSTDIFSLGSVLYHLLTGRPAVEGETTLETLNAVVSREPIRPATLNPQVDRDLETICLKCLEKDPQRRYPSADALANDLDHWVRHEPIQARRSSTWEHLRKWAKRNPAVAGLAGMVTLLAAFVVVTAPLVAVHQQRLRGKAELHAKQAELEQGRAQAKTRQAEAALYMARLNETRALRLARLQGWSELAFENIRQNAAVDLPQRDLLRLRNEAVACMGETDVQEITRVVGHPSSTWALDFSPDGTILARADNEGVTTLLDVATRTPFQTIRAAVATRPRAPELPAPYRAMCFHPRSNHVVYGTINRSVEMVSVLSPGRPVVRASSSGQAHQIDFDETGTVMALAWSDHRVAAYKAWTGKLIREFQLEGSGPHGREIAAISPDGTRLAAPGSNDSVVIYSLFGDPGPLRLGHHRLGLTSLRFSPGGALLLSTSADRTAKLFDLDPGGERACLRGHRALVESAAFLEHGNLIVTVSDDQTARLWNTHTAEPILVIRPRAGPLLSAAWSQAGGMLAVANRNVFLYRLINEDVRQVLYGYEYAVGGLAFHPTEPVLATGSYDNWIVLWDLPSGRLTQRWRGHPAGHPDEVAFSPSGDLIAAGHKSYSNRQTRDHTVRVWETATGTLKHALRGHNRSARCVAFDRSGALLASGDSQCVILWNLLNGQEERYWGEAGTVVGLEFVGSGSGLLIAGASGRIRLCDYLTGAILAQTTAPSRLRDLAVAPNQEQCAVAGTDGSIYRYALPALGQVARLDRVHEGEVAAVAFDPEGRMLASGGQDRQTFLWDAQTGRKLLTLPPQESMLINLAFDPGGARLAICGIAEEVTIWNLSLVREQLTRLGLDWAEPDPFSPADANSLSPPPREGPSPTPTTARPARAPRHSLAHSWLHQDRPAPTNAVAVARLAHMLGQDPQGHPEEFALADALSLKAIEISPNESEVWLVRAEILENNNHATEARAVLDQAIEQHPRLPVLRMAKGQLLARLGLLPEADDLFHQSIELVQASPSTPREILTEAHLQRARLLERQGRLDDAGHENCRARGIPLRHPQTPRQLIDLSRFYNFALTSSLMSPPGTNLISMATGVQTYAQVEFDVRGAIQLAGANLVTVRAEYGSSVYTYPTAVTSVPIGCRVTQLHFLHGTGWTESEAAKVGAYVLRYADGEEVELPILYGQDLRNWWCCVPGQIKEASRAVVAWVGETEKSKQRNQTIQVYRVSRPNPRPDVTVTQLDFVSAMSQCAPFLIAITVDPVPEWGIPDSGPPAASRSPKVRPR